MLNLKPNETLHIRFDWVDGVVFTIRGRRIPSDPLSEPYGVQYSVPLFGNTRDFRAQIVELILVDLQKRLDKLKLSLVGAV